MDTVLIVDDHRTNRVKLAAAVRSLGYAAEAAAGGLEAVEMLRSRQCDAVLLDILMPGMDGFDVLRVLKEDELLRDIPVIVVSALDDDTASVVRAIELGAEDFLPKDFDPVILRARLAASLQKKHFRDQEREFRRLVGQLTEAAETLESESLRPERLAIDDVAAREDSLGRLARVFKSMAEEIYERERRLRRNVRSARGGLLVLAVGASFGILAPLSRMAAGLDTDPVGLTVWVNIVGAVTCLGLAAARGRLPRLSWSLLRFCLFWGFLTGVAEKLLLFWVAAHVQAMTISLIVTLEGFMVFAVAAVIGLEKATLRRLAGLLLGLVGALLVIVTRQSLLGGEGLVWLLLALCVPLLFTLEGVLAVRLPEAVDVTAAVGLIMFASFAMVIPLAVLTGEVLPLGPSIGRLEIVVGAMAIADVLATVLWFYLTRLAGPVFASQSAYAVTIAGIVWSMLLLDEQMPALAWGALVLMFAGLYLVEPRASSEDEDFRLPARMQKRPKTATASQPRGAAPRPGAAGCDPPPG